MPRSIFTLACLNFYDLAFDLRCRNRKIKNIQYGAVVYRDPIDYIQISTGISDIKEEEKRKAKQLIIEKLKKANLYDEEFEDEKNKLPKFYDKNSFPINKNVSIQFTEMENLVNELQKVECGGGNDEPEDWVGALNLALYDLDWDEESAKIIVWISDSNSHGKRFCGFDNHNEEEIKLKYLVEDMFDQKINFLGINLIKNKKNRGCEMTLNEMKKIFDEQASKTDEKCRLNFFTQNFHIDYDDSLYGVDNWPDKLMCDFTQQIANELNKMIENIFS